MSFDMIYTFSVLAIAVLFFIFEWIRADVVAVLVLVSLTVGGVLTPDEAFAGFSSNAVIAIGALLVVSTGLVRSGVVKWIADHLKSIVRDSRRLLILTSTLIPGILSGFINIVAAVTIFIPAVRRMARQSNQDSAILLLPMAVTGLVGANLSLIGASHNLVVDSLLQEAASESFGFFEFSPIGAVLVVVAVIHALLFGPWLLKGKKDNGSEEEDQHTDDEDLINIYEMNNRLWEILVMSGSSVAGKPLKEIGMGTDYGLNPILVLRNGDQHPVENSDFRLAEKDVVAVGGREERVMAFAQSHDNISVLGQPDLKEEYSWSAFELVEVVVPPRSPAIDRTLREIHVRRDFGLTCIALWRKDQAYRTETRDRKLKEGDALLLFGSRERVCRFDPKPDFLWRHPPQEEEAPAELRHLGPWAALIFLAVILSAAFNLVSIAVAALAGAVLMILIGILTPRQSYDAISWKTLILIGGMYPVGTALEKTGAASLLSDLIVNSVGTYGTIYALVGVAFLAMVLTQPMHNAVVAVIMTPVAVKVAEALSSNPKAFAVAVIVGASASFLMPVGHPAPLLVQKPGGYSNADYFKYGIGLNLVILAVVAGMVPLLWSL